MSRHRPLASNVIVMAVSICLLALLSNACGRKSEIETPGDVKLVFWHGIESISNSAVLAEKIEKFHADHPEISIVLQHYGAADQVRGKIMTAIAGNRPPDLMWWGPQATGFLARSGALLSVQDFIDGDPHFAPADVYEQLWDLCKHKGIIYAVPFDTNNLALYYNLDHFKQADIDPHQIQTWQDLLTAARRLTIDTDGDGRPERYGFQVPLGNSEWTVWTWQTFLWQAGGEFLSSDGKRAAFDSDAGVAALKFWVDMVHKHRVANFSEPGAGYKVDAFIAGHISMMINGPWNFRVLKEAEEKNNLRYGAVFLPRNPHTATNTGGENLYIFKSEALREKAAWKFAKFILSPEFQTDWAIQTGYLPVNRKVRKQPAYRQFLKQHPFIQTFVDQIPYGRARPTIPEYTQISSKLGKQIEMALYQKASPRKTLRVAAAFANDVLTEAR